MAKRRSPNLQNIFSSFAIATVAMSAVMTFLLDFDPANRFALAESSESNHNSRQFVLIDLEDHWSRSFVYGLLTKKNLRDVLAPSEAVSYFQPDRPITRAELGNLLEIVLPNRNAPKINTRLNEFATKAEAIVAIASYLNLNILDSKMPQTYLLSMYRDASAIPDYAIPAIAMFTQQGLAINYPDPRSLTPTFKITKGELAVLLYQALSHQKKLPYLRSPYAINPNRKLWYQKFGQVTRLEVSISKREVTAFRGEIPIKSYPVAVGKTGWSTPMGDHRVLQRVEYPTWQNPFTGEVIASRDPENPLGDRWIGFWTDGKNWSGFHGTPNRNSVGQAASHGCIRMYNEDIRELFSQVSEATTVKVLP
jgi:hypothetical protein